MNRRIVFPATVFGLALCFAILALPVQPVAAHNPKQATAEATVDPCNPKKMIPGLIVGDSLFAFTKASQASIPTILVKKNDVVEVIGRSQNGVWIKILTNAGVEGWVPSAYIQVDRKQLAKLDVVTTDAGAPAGTQAATMEGTMAGTQAAMSCPGIPGTITGDLLALKTEPSTKSKDTGVYLMNGQQSEDLLLNSYRTLCN